MTRREQFRAMVDEMFSACGGVDGAIELLESLDEDEDVVANAAGFDAHETPEVLGHSIMDRPRFAFEVKTGKLDKPRVLRPERRN